MAALTRKRVVRAVVFAAAIVLVSLGCYRAYCELFVVAPIPPHHGDGEFHDITRKPGPLVIRGYEISMPSFDLGKPLTAEYHLASLPDIGRDCGTYLAYRDPKSLSYGLHRLLDGWLELEVTDRRGRVVAASSGRLRDYTCMQTLDLHAFYQLNKSSFRPDRGEEYTIRLSYQPDVRLAGHRGYAYVRSGGGK